MIYNPEKYTLSPDFWHQMLKKPHTQTKRMEKDDEGRNLTQLNALRG
jgi:hypothetical protein